MTQRDIGGGGGIKMKCMSGCLQILKILYSCEEKDESNPEQLEFVKALCNNKEKCSVQASREVFGEEECPGTPDKNMLMWVVYRCNGGEDRTKLTGGTSYQPDRQGM